MYLNGFSLVVTPGKELPGGYVQLEHKTNYRLRLRNFYDEPCDARVEIQGEHVGTWRIPANGSAVIERPANVAKLFTFYAANTPEARKVDELPEWSNKRGLVTVTFTPEKRQTWQEFNSRPEVLENTGMFDLGLQSRSANLYSMPKSLTAGTTGLSGKSNQTFGIAEKIRYDTSRRTTIHLRLVGEDGGDEPLPLSVCSTPIPPLI